MSVRLYRIEPFQHPQENGAFEMLCRSAQVYLRDLEDVRIVGNLVYDGGQIDVLVLARHSMTIVDFKDWGGAITVRRDRPWTNHEGKPVLGGSYVNPYAQTCAYKEKVQTAFSAAPELAGNDFTHINGLVLFTQPVELQVDQADAIGPVAGKWFHVADWTGGMGILRNAASPKINLTAEILDEIMVDLKAAPFEPMTGQRLVPESAIFDALMDQHYAEMAEWELEHRDEINAQYEKAQEGWLRMDFPEKP